MWLLIDNYDSFTHILTDYIRRYHADIKVIRNDEWKLSDIIDCKPERIILSPGPGQPSDIILNTRVVAHYHEHIPILGICLGHQVLGTFYGGICIPSGNPMHGKTSPLKVTCVHPVFQGIPEEDVRVMHYHSLVVQETERSSFKPIAYSGNGMIMALAHDHFPSLGLQFHPESILTTYGDRMIQNWVEMY